MKEVSSTAIQQKEIDFKKYCNQKFSKDRKGKPIGHPKFKKRGNKQSYRLSNNNIKLKNGKIRLEKIGYIKVVIDRSIPEDAKYMNVTVSKNPAGQYFVSVCVECEINQLPKTHETIGIDVGLKAFLTPTIGDPVANPRFYRESQAKVAHLQRIVCRKVKGSNRWNKLRLRIARLHNQIANQRAYFLHTESTKLVQQYDIICVEDLNVSGMVQNHKLALSISDASWTMFMTMLAYKCNWYGKELVKIDRYAPSSKTCSDCGWVDEDQTLKDRVFACPICGLVIDRDLNAAINIQALGVDSAERMQRERVADPNEASNNIIVTC